MQKASLKFLCEADGQVLLTSRYLKQSEQQKIM